MKRQVEFAAFEEVQVSIKRRFPQLRTELIMPHPHIDALLEIPAQSGLKFPVSINLQNCDELHLNAGSFWCEWFPCWKREVVDQFVEAVCGLLGGDCRIIESRRGNEALKAQLQRREGEGWMTVATWSKFHLPIGRGWRTTILQNTEEPKQLSEPTSGMAPGRGSA